MTPLEQETLREGFRVALLEAWSHRATGVLTFRAYLFDGGKRVDEAR